MSEEQLKAFIAKVQGDTSLQEQLKADGVDVIAIAKAAGFTITTEDLNSHRQNLTDDELEDVAGGRNDREMCEMMSLLDIRNQTGTMSLLWRMTGTDRL